MSDLDSLLLTEQPNSTTDFQNLMRRRVQDILVVSSLYDSFLLASDGQLQEQMASEFMELSLSHTPRLTHASDAEQALADLKAGASCDLIITTTHVGDMPVVEFARKLREMGVEAPIVLLAFDDHELAELGNLKASRLFDHAFLWQGDFRILLAIVKCFEDRWNLEHDARAVGVQAILLIEDNVRFYSSYLPMFYAEVMSHSQSLISESVNRYHRLLRMRARPKIIHCETFEEAWSTFENYEDYILGIVSDIEFPEAGSLSPEAGMRFARRAKEKRPDIPILLQSSEIGIARMADELNASFVRKGSPTLHGELRQFMMANFGFGDFIFRTEEGYELDRATDMRSLELKLHTVRAESIRFHAERDHFSSWLKARTEFGLARRLKPRKVSDYPTLEDLRRDLIDNVRSFRIERSRGHVVDFNPDTFDASSTFVRIGGGSLGGKARGLAYMNHILTRSAPDPAFEGIEISVPPCVVLCTEVFDRFMDLNNLRQFALQTEDEEEISRRFLVAELPSDIRDALATYLNTARYPIAVRSSSLLEDSQLHPFAGVYRTYMLPNNHRRPRTRLAQLEAAVKRVYASTYSQSARTYVAATLYRLEEEKMAVIVQRLVGARHGDRFYPDFAGVARSHNFYPTPPQRPSDGVVVAALGLGKTVVEGGTALRFCPKFPRHLMQFASPRDYLKYTQESFFALDVSDADGEHDPAHTVDLTQFGLDVAENDGTLDAVGSVYSAENDCIYDGLSRDGMRVVSFAPILKDRLFPLAALATHVLNIGTHSMSYPVEVEFAVNLSVHNGSPREFGVLQARPFVVSRETVGLDIGEHAAEELLCRSSQVLGVGKVENVCDLIVVDRDTFERAQSPKVAEEVGRLNSKLAARGIPYLLIGVGRWGSSDPWLGIPVKWDQIAGAKVIVETGFKDFKVTPSQGAHFFQNLIARGIGYFTVNPDSGDGLLDWDWLQQQTPVERTDYVCHLQFQHPLRVLMNGHKNEGVILKPGV